MKYIFTLILIGISLEAQQGFGDAFQSLGTSTRTAGLGQAVVADFGDIAAYIVNPAATQAENRFSNYGLYINQFGMAEYGSAGFSRTYHNTNWRWGIHGIGLWVDNILERPDLRKIVDLETRRDSIRVLVQKGFTTFSDLETSLTFNLSNQYHYKLDLGWRTEIIPITIPIGVNLHVIHKDLYTLKGSGIGLDLGGMLQFELNDLLQADWFGTIGIGVSLKHLLGTRIYWNTPKQDLIPMHTIVGFSYHQPIPQIGVDLVYFSQKISLYPNEVNSGFEIAIKSLLRIQVGLRADYLQGGIDLNVSKLLFPGYIGYGFSSHDLGIIHRFGIQVEL